MENLEGVVISSRAISHPHDPYEDVVSFLINEFAEGEMPWQVQQFSNGDLVDSEYFDTEAEAEAWVAREATLTASVARHDLEQAREALATMRDAIAKALPWIEMTGIADDEPEEWAGLVAALTAAGGPHDAPDAAPAAPQTPEPEPCPMSSNPQHETCPLCGAQRSVGCGYGEA